MLVINCLCGDSRQVLESRPSPTPLLLISDSEEERHGSGVLFVSHHLIKPPGQEGLSRLSAYDYGRITRFFCRTCGCHVFRRHSLYDSASTLAARSLRDWSPSSTAATAGGDTPGTGSPRKVISRQSTPVGDGAPAAPADTHMGAPTLTGVYGEGGLQVFEVATGVISESPAIATTHEDVGYSTHPVVDTVDGGLAPWLSVPKMEGRTIVRTRTHVEPSSQAIPAFCQCGKVQLRISRPQDVFPDGGAQYPYSPYSDLIYPYKTTPKSVVDNPSDEKWYLRHDNTKYLAGTCACRSCRLSTGYEVQTWAFIPRAAINISVTSSPPISPFSSDYTPPDPDSYIPLDFEELSRQPANPFRSYESSPGVFREFCPGCGATVFWHAKVRPDLIDVSVGLLHAGEGARAESLLDWWRGRCSFAEDAGLDRTGWAKGLAEGLIEGLEQGMRDKA